MEKDFWVCWTLKRLLENSDLAQHITFKGGTSLSKAYHLIERFSEDIDLTIGRAAPHVIDGESPMEEGPSRKKRERRVETLRQNAGGNHASRALCER
jgi:predicted nucleotidyltransferase component of viral defense system